MLFRSERAEFRRELAGGAFNLLNRYIGANRLEAARACLERIEQIAASHPNDVEIRLRLARGAVNLIKTCATAGRAEEAAAIAVACRAALCAPEFREAIRQHAGPEGAAQFDALLAGLFGAGAPRARSAPATH